jgi:hypothetical protein
MLASHPLDTLHRHAGQPEQNRRTFLHSLWLLRQLSMINSQC